LLQANYLGEGDKHDQAHDNTEVIVSLTKYKSNTTKDVHGHCVYSFYLYSSDTFKRSSESSLPVICTICVSVIFIVMALTFCIYDEFVRRRNTKVVNAAARSNAIVSSLFPTNVRDRLFAEKEDEQANAKNKAQGPQNLKTMLHSGEFMKADPDDELVDDIMYKSKPIADLFPETTILFAGEYSKTCFQIICLLSNVSKFSDNHSLCQILRALQLGQVYESPHKSSSYSKHSTAPLTK